MHFCQTNFFFFAFYNGFAINVEEFSKMKAKHWASNKLETKLKFVRLKEKNGGGWEPEGEEGKGRE